MTSEKQGVSADQTDVSYGLPDLIVVQIVIMNEDIISDFFKFIQHIIDCFGESVLG